MKTEKSFLKGQRHICVYQQTEYLLSSLPESGSHDPGSLPVSPPPPKPFTNIIRACQFFVTVFQICYNPARLPYSKWVLSECFYKLIYKCS